MNKQWTKLRITRLILQIAAIACIFLPYYGISGFFDFSVSGFDIVAGSIVTDVLEDLSSDFGGAYFLVRTIIILPLALAVFALFLTIINGRTASKVFGIIHSIVQLICYGLWLGTFAIMDMTSLAGLGTWLQLMIPIALFVVCVMTKKEKIYSYSNEANGSSNANTGEMLGLNGMYAGARIPIDAKGIIIGRDSKVGNLVIDNAKVSRKHCTILYDEKNHTYHVIDHSTNGIFRKDGSRIQAENAVEIGKDEEICIGNGDNSFVFL